MQNDLISRNKMFTSLKREAGVVIADQRYPTGNYYGMNATPEEVANAWNRRPTNA